MAARQQAPLFGIGVFFGVLLGSFLSLALTTHDSSETFEEHQEHLGTAQPARRGGGGGGEVQVSRQERARRSLAKVHFMKKFVKALTSLPLNRHPRPDYEVLLKDPKHPLVCADCHASDDLNIDAMKEMDPGSAAVERYRSDPRFMIPLMKKWVERLNKNHADRLVGLVTCRSCHAVDPLEKWRVYPPLMRAFVMALKTKPTNPNPASGWKPLLKDPSTKSMLCGYCHGDEGERMDAALQSNPDLPRPVEYAENKGFMVNLMQAWVKRANRELAGILVKTIVCLDCHETDPRR